MTRHYPGLPGHRSGKSPASGRIRYRRLLGGLLLFPCLVFPQPDSGRDSLTTGTVSVHHHPTRLVKFGAKLEGRRVGPGSSRWKDFEIFQGYSLRGGDTTVFSDLRPGRYSVWGLDTADRQVYVTFDLGKQERRHVDARTGTTFTGKRAVGTLENKASKAPIPGARVYYKCIASEPPVQPRLVLREGVVISDSLGHFETPPCLNERDTLIVQQLGTADSTRTGLIKMTRAMDADSLFRVGVISLGGKFKLMNRQEKQWLTFSALTYSVGFPISEVGLTHSFSHSLYSRFLGMDYGMEQPTGSAFVNIKGFILFAPMLRGNWTIPLGYLGTGLGLYRTRDENIGYQAQAWYNLLFAHVNVKVRKDFDGPYRSTWGLGFSIPVHLPVKNKSW